MDSRTIWHNTDYYIAYRPTHIGFTWVNKTMLQKHSGNFDTILPQNQLPRGKRQSYQ